MTSLQLLIQDLHLNECETMNTLQNHGIISDLCVTAADVGGEDRLRAVDWLINKDRQWNCKTTGGPSTSMKTGETVAAS